ncbi:MAG: 2-hydroxyacyl-CoA dehydratase family protein [Armatimonadota bacterium]
MKIIYSCPFIPAEWIAAHGLLPSRISAGSSTLKLGPGVCPYACSFAGAAIEEKTAAGVIVTTACDQMRRIYDVITENTDLSAFLMHVPHTWQTVEAQRLYISELKRLGDFLIELGGNTPTPDILRQTMIEYNDNRAALRDLQGSLSPRDWALRLSEFNRTGKFDQAIQDTKYTPSGVPVALVGGPIPANQCDIYDFIESAGGYVSLDATETGERTLPAPFDRRLLKENPVSALIDSYFNTIYDAFRRPNNELFKWLKLKLTERGVRGIILRRYLWCDNWNAEAYRLKEWSGLPFTQIDANDDGTVDVRTSSRIQAFMESIK